MIKNFSTLIIVNRGEIAVRIIRTARRLGLKTFLIASDADRETQGAIDADRVFFLPGARASETYLNQNRILEIIKSVPNCAVHPGYGFLSENSEFAKAVVECGAIWVGPSAAAMEKISSKANSKELAKKAGVPVIPGSSSVTVEDARRIGYPIFLKASAGGGGRGIRKVNSDDELKSQLPLAQQEAMNSFGDGEIIIEKMIEQGHHVEIQVFGDSHGGAVHLGERDCSVQRRHQKLIEESPSPIVSPELREKMTAAALTLVQAAGYANAGTVEFLVTPTGDFYFLEMNTRLQVEHPVTEFVTGLDFVEWQLRIADGERIPKAQNEIRFHGSSIQARLYAEDPFDGFRPQTGRIEGFRFPKDVRVDHFLTSRTAITSYYDSMLAKLIVHGETRDEAIAKLKSALELTVIAGPTTNLNYLTQILEAKPFREGKWTTRILDTVQFAKPRGDDEFAEMLAALGYFMNSAKTEAHLQDFSNSLARESLVIIGRGESRKAFTIFRELTTVEIDSGPRTEIFENVKWSGSVLTWSQNEIPMIICDEQIWFNWLGKSYRFDHGFQRGEKLAQSINANEVRSPMDGTVIRLLVDPGANVLAGQVLVVIEAMKMQMELRSARDGAVESVDVRAGQQVRNRQILIQLKTDLKKEEAHGKI